ncbi:MAG: hypothetical protein EHM32_05115 [Spirochaetales bacterium]|nr:MAG: hypothetical protein EHM32_05115 [Spirochaetales bacterium]
MKTEYRIKTLRKIIGKAINRYGMIADGDRILVALSGGIDSLVLLDAIAGRRRALPVSYYIAAAHVRMEGLGDRLMSDLSKPSAASGTWSWWCERPEGRSIIQSLIRDASSARGTEGRRFSH